MVLIVNKPTVHVQVSFTVHQHATKLTNGIILQVPEDTVVCTFFVLCFFVCVFRFCLPAGARQQFVVLHQEFFAANLVQPRELQ